MGGAISSRVPDNLWQGANDAFRQMTRRAGAVCRGKDPHSAAALFLLAAPAPKIVALITVAGAGGKLAGIFLAAAWASVGGATARGGIRTTALITHLGRKATGTVFVE